MSDRYPIILPKEYRFKERRDQVVTIRVKRSDKERMSKKAEKAGKTLSEYVTDCGLAGLERHRDKDKKRVVQMIRNQERFNEMERCLKEQGATEEVFNIFNELKEEEMRLWQY